MRVVKNSAVVLSFLAVAAILGVLASAIVARRVGPAVVGALAIGLLTVELGSILDNWSTPAHIRRASAADDDELASLFSSHLLMKLGFGLLAGAAIFLSAPWIAGIYNAEVRIFELFALLPPLGAASSAIHNTLEARRRMVGRGVMDVVTAGGYLVFAYLVVTTGPQAVVGRALAAGATVLVGAALFFPGLQRPRLERLREYARFGARTAPSNLVMKSIFWTDTALIGFFLSTAQAGIYQVAYGLAFFLTVAASSVSTALFPELSSGALEEDDRGFEEAYTQGFITIALLIGAGALTLAVLAPVVVPFLYSEAFSGSVPILQVLAGSFLLNALAIPSAQALTAADMPGLVLKIQSVMAAVNVSGNAVLIPVVGIQGAVAMTFVTFGLGTAAMILTARRHLEVEPPRRLDTYRSFVTAAYQGLRSKLQQSP